MNYIIYGKEELIIKRFTKKLVKQFLGDEIDDFNCAKVDFAEDKPINILSEIESLPLGYDKKVTIVDNATFLDKKYDEKDVFQKNLLSILENNSEDLCVILIFKSEKIDAKNEFVKLINKIGKVYGANGFNNESDWSKYINEKVTKAGGTIEPRATSELIKRATSDFYYFENSFNKLINYDKNITYENVINLINEPLDDNNFNLLNFLLMDKTENALKTFNDLKTIGTEPATLVAMLTTQIKFYDQVVYLSKDKKMSNAEIAKLLKSSDARIYMTLKNCRSYTSQSFKNIFHALYNLEKDIKTGKADRFALFELFILNFSKLK